MIRGLRKLVGPRRFRAYSLGTAKSGTASIASMFAAHYRAAHEADERTLLDYVLDAGPAAGADGLEPAGPFPVERRDRRLRLEMDSSQLNFFIAADLVRAFPDARFIVTMRDCFTWLESFINHTLSRSCNERWRRFREHRFRHAELTHPPEERALAERGLYTLEGYLSYWAHHNRRALEIIPESRRLIVRTDGITDAIPAIAGFLDIAPETLTRGASHANPAQGRHAVLDEVPAAHLHAVARRHCAPLMDQFFPESCRWNR